MTLWIIIIQAAFVCRYIYSISCCKIKYLNCLETGLSSTLHPPHAHNFNSQDALVLRLHKPKSHKQVQWQEGVVDNEFMGKKSSKCENIQNGHTHANIVFNIVFNSFPPPRLLCLFKAPQI